MTYTIGFIAAWARQNCSIDAREVPDASISRAKAAYYFLLDSLLREAIEPVSSLRRVVMAVPHGGTDGIHVRHLHCSSSRSNVASEVPEEVNF